ncbi:MAG: HNH endonuclease signature motif containing protein [Polaromonas sp.]|nr:HNH endonuclease signature motif containing protein [Polaromonas sp.]
MKQEEITVDQAQAAFICDEATGALLWRVDGPYKRLAGKPAGKTDRQGYVRVMFNRRAHMAHRIVWMLVTKQKPSAVIDHINGVKSDNRIVNLREATTQVNNQNRRTPSRNNTTGFLGVSRATNCTHKPFVAQIKLDGKKRVLGYFATAEQAHFAYVAAKRELHSGNTI